MPFIMCLGLMENRKCVDNSFPRWAVKPRFPVTSSLVFNPAAMRYCVNWWNLWRFEFESSLSNECNLPSFDCSSYRYKWSLFWRFSAVFCSVAMLYNLWGKRCSCSKGFLHRFFICDILTSWRHTPNWRPTFLYRRKTNEGITTELNPRQKN